VPAPNSGFIAIACGGAHSLGLKSDTALPIFDGNDFDGDLRSDISVWRPDAGIWWLKGIGVYLWGEEGDIPVPGDYNGDTITDIAVWKPSTGMWWIQGTGVIQWGEEADIPLVRGKT
jgi:hypothetical protein